MKYYIFKITKMRCFEKFGLPRKKRLKTRERTNNKLKPHVGLHQGIKSGSHCWVLLPLIHPCSTMHVSRYMYIYCQCYKSNNCRSHLQKSITKDNSMCKDLNMGASTPARPAFYMMIMCAAKKDHLGYKIMANILT